VWQRHKTFAVPIEDATMIRSALFAVTIGTWADDMKPDDPRAIQEGRHGVAERVLTSR
jgi:hypothetical protein